jgi:FSR family fosmidomycin resistance protein-like MFS transporter
LLGTTLALRYGTSGTGWLFVPGAVFAATLWLLMPRWTGRADRERADSPAERGQTQAPPAIARLSLRRRLAAVGVLVAAVAVRSTVTNSLNSFVPLFLVGVAGADKGYAGRVLAGMLLAGALATVAGGYLADRWGRLRVFAASLLLVPPLLLGFVALGGQGVVAIAALWLAGALLTASFSVTVVLAQELWYERRALASGVIVGFAFGMGGLFVPAVGAAADRWGLPLAFQAIALLPLTVLALIGALSLLLRASPRSVA